jgi:hypothetical protein
MVEFDQSSIHREDAEPSHKVKPNFWGEFGMVSTSHSPNQASAWSACISMADVEE